MRQIVCSSYCGCNRKKTTLNNDRSVSSAFFSCSARGRNRHDIRTSRVLSRSSSGISRQTGSAASDSCKGSKPQNSKYNIASKTLRLFFMSGVLRECISSSLLRQSSTLLSPLWFSLCPRLRSRFFSSLSSFHILSPFYPHPLSVHASRNDFSLPSTLAFNLSVSTPKSQHVLQKYPGSSFRSISASIPPQATRKDSELRFGYFSLLSPFRSSFCSTTMTAGAAADHGTFVSYKNAAAAPSAAGTKTPAAHRVAQVRELMKSMDIDAYVLYSGDAHGSEMCEPCDERRRFLTDFDGSSGTAVVTLEEALLWTDGRYFLQAEQQLDPTVWKLMKQNVPGYLKIQEWLYNNPKVHRVGMEGWCSPAFEYSRFLQSNFTPFPRGGRSGLTCDSCINPSEAAAATANENFTNSRSSISKQVTVLKESIIDKVWDSTRPPRSSAPLYIHPLKYAGKKIEQKVEEVAQQMRAAEVDVLILSALDDVAWLLNLRGEDIKTACLFDAYCLITLAATAANKSLAVSGTSPTFSAATSQAADPLVVVYTNEARVTEDIFAHLSAASCVLIRPYEAIEQDFRAALLDRKTFVAKAAASAIKSPTSASKTTNQLPLEQQGRAIDKASTKAANINAANKEAATTAAGDFETFADSADASDIVGEKAERINSSGKRLEPSAKARAVWLDPSVNVALFLVANECGVRVILKGTPAAMLKAVKNEAELEGMKEGHILDGIALSKFFTWLEKQVKSPEINDLNEWVVSKVVDTFRSLSPQFKSISFNTIAAVDSNAAIVHYRATKEKNLPLTNSCVFLLDGGGQYVVGGTTDITRTIHRGEPTEEQKIWFTRVLKGFIALYSQKFPKGTRGPQLDALARQHLWAVGVDYRHGTGHGVGSLLCVHEGPIGITPNLICQAGEAELTAGHVCSIEPGYYKKDELGIRIENLAYVAESPVSNNFEDMKFFQFEHLTLVPIQKKFISFSIITEEEINWLNNYHSLIWETLSPRLRDGAGKSEDNKRIPVQDVPGAYITTPTVEETLHWLEEATSPMVFQRSH